jgi:CBS domain-containing protein
MTLQEILNNKGTAVYHIGPDETLAEVVRRLFQHGVGSLLVCEGGACRSRLLGIITERDILRALALDDCSLDELQVRDYMTREEKIVTGHPSDEVGQVMGLMTERRIRHLPVVADEALVGIVSIGDVVKIQYDQMALENHYLKSYLNGGISAEA